MLKSCKHILFSGLFGFLFLVLFKTGLLYHLNQYSLFCPKGDWLLTFFEQPGGILALTGAFLTQFCHYPVLGAAIFALLMCLLTFLTEKAFGLEGRAAWLSTLPSLFLLLFITRMDYSTYLFRTYGLMYSQVLGFCVTSALVLLYRKGFLGKRTGPLFVAVAVLAGYPLFGAFALLAALLMGMLALREGKRGFLELAVALLAGAAVLWLCREQPWIFPRIHRQYVYFAALPYMEFLDNFICLVPLILTAAAMVALCFLGKAGRFVVPALLGATILTSRRFLLGPGLPYCPGDGTGRVRTGLGPSPEAGQERTGSQPRPCPLSQCGPLPAGFPAGEDVPIPGRRCSAAHESPSPALQHLRRSRPILLRHAQLVRPPGHGEFLHFLKVHPLL